MTATYVQTVIALAAVVGLILFMSFVLKKRQTKTGLMNIVAYQSFGPKKGLAALKMGKEVLLLGLTSTDIRLLRTFAENEFDAQAAGEGGDRLKMLREMKERLNEHEHK